jgi:phosphoribosylformylglycinamidine synthase
MGTAIAVAEAARNIICSGAEPTAITNCLNFGNPYSPEVYWTFVGAIKGMGAACRKFDTPVTGGNVSFYNQSVFDSKVEPVFPTPTIGMLGLLKSKKDRMTLHFKASGDLIYLVGQSRDDISSSEYLYSYHGIKGSPAPFINLDEEALLHELLLQLIRSGEVASVHDVSDGGLFISLFESARAGQLGFDISTDEEIRTDAFLFGESQSRAVVTVKPEMQEAFVERLTASEIEFTYLGEVTALDEMMIDGQSFGTLTKAVELYDGVLGGKMA